MLLTISEVRGWQNQEKTAGGMCCEPVRVREKTVAIWNYYTDRISTAKMLLTISEVRGWQNQEKTAGGMCCEPVRVREKTVAILILIQI